MAWFGELAAGVLHYLNCGISTCSLRRIVITIGSNNFVLTGNRCCVLTRSKGHSRSHSAPPLLSSPHPEEEFPPLGPPNTPPGVPRYIGPPRYHHTPPEPFPHPSSAHPEEFPPLSPGGGGPPNAFPGAWTGFPGPGRTSPYPRPDSPPPVPPRRRRPSHSQTQPPRSPSRDR